MGLRRWYYRRRTVGTVVVAAVAGCSRKVGVLVLDFRVYVTESVLDHIQYFLVSRGCSLTGARQNAFRLGIRVKYAICRTSEQEGRVLQGNQVCK